LTHCAKFIHQNPKGVTNATSLVAYRFMTRFDDVLASMTFKHPMKKR